MASKSLHSTLRSSLSRKTSCLLIRHVAITSRSTQANAQVPIGSTLVKRPSQSSHPATRSIPSQTPPSKLLPVGEPVQRALTRTKKIQTKEKPLSEEEKENQRIQREVELTAQLEKSFRPPKILFENEKVVVIDKPAGCALQADPGSEAYIRWKLIMDYLEKRRGKLFIVHRLDKSTTGPLILAKSPTASRTLSTQFKNSTIKKIYYAAIQFLGDRIGPIQDAKSSGQIECRMRDRNDRMVIAEANRTGADCKQTKTEWELVTATSNHAIVRLRPHTGRKHQLRLHCSRFLAGPIVGDFKYDFRYLSHQSQKAIHNFLNREAPGRILLHCSEIEFKLYKKEQPREYTVRVSSPIHDDFRIVCDQLDLSTTSIL
ncbi:hypothetical protein PTTG_02223 [Puccinia triticina 1-1 BBBD Race 1]|uniref:21S rRNA pseudouridine(2819) synthase n=1 Tax=Puccinia triticina (isolate 1-1 / race 1 (BBBD)) TaxID=630390 RepID=A0A180GJ75_PUCT1|nr:hypothetical protein PTTG_02223 [Puccinia triticina 1-1 BBBD Race 1]